MSAYYLASFIFFFHHAKEIVKGDGDRGRKRNNIKDRKRIYCAAEQFVGPIFILLIRQRRHIKQS